MIRLATQADLPELMRLGRAMHAEGPEFGIEPLDEAVAERALGQLIGLGTLLVAADGAALVGFVAIVVLRRFWTGAEFAEEAALYVAPEWRRAGVGVSLMQAAEAVAGRLGARWLDAGDSSGLKVASWLYLGLGYHEVARKYRKALVRPPDAE